ncbi:uncharacterized protein PG998_013178 [Apiospora kogelbergensis]|uniref:uncharacterized protein n=1 Tax=Apiospora kogelbergensis TaxID=1337665 RepID=UPI00312ECBC5
MASVNPQSKFPTAPAEPSPSTTTPLKWRPFYLRRRVLLGFILIFSLILGTVETLFVVSNKNSGIATSTPSNHHLWVNGPTAFLTIIAAIWTRAEYQSKLIAPWTRLSQPETPASKSLLLDYVSMSPFIIPFTSIRNRDFLVSITTAIGLIIKLIIVLSSGLITLTWTGVQGSHPMVLQDQIVDSDTQLHNVGTLPWHIIQESRSQNFLFPDGISRAYAFQSVKSDLPGGVETRTVVQGIINTLDCEKVEVKLRGAMPPNDSNNGQGLNLTINSPQCTVSKLKMGGVQWSGEDNTTAVINFARFTRTTCDGTTGDAGRRVFVIFGEMSYTRDPSQNEYLAFTGTLKKSTQLLCVPRYTIMNLEVVRNGTQTRSITPLQVSTTRTLDSVSPWRIMDALFAASDGVMSPYGYYYQQSIEISSALVDVDTYTKTLLKSQWYSGQEVASLYDRQFLQGIATDYYMQFSAIIAKVCLMRPQSTDITGLATVNQYRLLVQAWAAQWIAGLVILCVVLAIISLFLVPREDILPSNPSSILNMTSIAFYSKELLRRLRYAGLADDKYLDKYLKGKAFQSTTALDPATGQKQFCIIGDGDAEPAKQASSDPYHPPLLHPIFRSSLCIGLVSMLITLELTLQESNKNEGIGDAGNDSYLHYTWTAIPTLVCGLFALSLSATDSCIRALAPYMILRKGVHVARMTSADLLDASLPRILYREVKFTNIGLLATTTAFLIASLFTIFSGSLFQVLPLATTVPTTLQALRNFDPYSFDSSGDRDLAYSSVSSTILGGNVSYPRFTYDDLAFPELSSAPSLGTIPNVRTASIPTIAAVIPAIRGKLSCRSYGVSKIRTHIAWGNVTSITHRIHQNPLEIGIEGEECGISHTESSGYNAILSTYPNATYFGLASKSNANTINGCSELLYIWGRIDYKANPIVQHVSALGCNTTFETVDADVTFTGSQLDMDERAPPRLHQTTARNTSSTKLHFRAWFSYMYLASLSLDPQLLDNFFSLLVSSPWAVLLSDLGDAAASGRIAAAIEKQHGIVAAQYIAQQRVPANQTNNLGLVSGPAAFDDRGRYNATATYAAGRRRVVQDATATRILEALLAAALVSAALGWATQPRTDVMPRGRPASIASVLALIAGGNMLARWPQPSSTCDKDDRGLKLWMGWGLVPDDEGRACGGENEAGTSQFGIFVMDEEEEGSVRDKDTVERGSVQRWLGAAAQGLSDCCTPRRRHRKS